MTIDTERWETVRWTRTFLEKLAYSRPVIAERSVREEAAMLLRHYPEDWWIEDERTKGIPCRTD